MKVLEKQGVEKFLDTVFRCSDRDEVLSAIEQFKQTSGYKCPTSSVLAMHVILDLYSDTSTDQANVNRITTNLDAAADDLRHLSNLIRSLA